MVFMVLHRCYTGFGNVRMALLPQDHGEEGELRLAIVGHLQHRIYRPSGLLKYTDIPVQLIDIDQTDVVGSDARIVTLNDYEYWFRFPSEADATIFYRMLCHKLDLADEGEWELGEEDYWEEGPWTLQEVGASPAECRCDCHGRAG